VLALDASDAPRRRQDVGARDQRCGAEGR
jgi:hypothetical protein